MRRSRLKIFLLYFAPQFSVYTKFGIDPELRYSDDSMISINCTAVEDEVANSRFQQSELDYLIYNDPVAYADLILNGDPKAYLKNVTEYKPLD